MQGSFIKAKSTALHNGTHVHEGYAMKHTSLLQMKQHNVSVKAVSAAVSKGRALMPKEAPKKGDVKAEKAVAPVMSEERKEVTGGQ